MESILSNEPIVGIEALSTRLLVAPGQIIARRCLEICSQLRHIPDTDTSARLDCVMQRASAGLIVSCSGPTPNGNPSGTTCRMPEATKRVTNQQIRQILRSYGQLTSVDRTTEV